jgi:predicted HTH transcriptional regulator
MNREFNGYGFRGSAVTDQELETLLKRGYETYGVEFKGPGKRTHPAFLANVARAVLGMANRRDGGHVIIGVDSESLDPVGLEDDQADTWTYDELTASVNEYASPSVSFDLEVKVYQKRKLIIMRVHEFADIPILCRKDYHPTNVKKAAPILRRGACYVRSRHKPETSEIPSEEEMRELLELAIDKGVRKFVTRAQKAGLFPPVQTSPLLPNDEELFKNQIEDLG